MKVTQKELKAEIGKHFICDSRRTDLISKLIISMIVFCTVSYSTLSKVVNPTVRAASNFKRIQRFFQIFQFRFRTLRQLRMEPARTRGGRQGSLRACPWTAPIGSTVSGTSTY